MNTFHRRHLALFCTIFAVVFIAGCFLSFKIKFVVAICFVLLASLLVFLLLFLKKHRPKILKAVFCILFALLSLLTQITRTDYKLHIIENKFGDLSTVTAKIDEFIYKTSYSGSAIVSVKSIDDEDLSCKAIIDCEYGIDFSEGDVITGTFLINHIENSTDNDKYYRSDGVTLHLYSETNDISYVNHENSVKNYLNSLNQYIVKEIKADIKGDAGDFISALLLGDKSELSATITRDFKRAGLSHVVAISGMHLSIMMLIFEILLKKLKISKNIRGGIVIFIAFIYLGITGFLLSTVRAFIMALFVYLSYLLNVDNDMLTSLLFAVFTILLISPWAVYDIGMWLSFLSILGIFIASYFINTINNAIYKKYKHVKNKPKARIKILMYFVSSILITLLVNFCICFISWLFFNEISLISIITNIIITPIASVLLFLSAAFMILKLIKIGFLVGILSNLISVICNLMLYIVSRFSNIKGVTVSTHYPFAGYIIIITSILFLILLIVKLKRKYLIFLPIISCVISFSLCINAYNEYYEKITEVQYVNCGESEYILIHDNKDYTIIDITTGANKYCQDAYYKSIDNCATEIHSYVLTHYHSYSKISLDKLFKKAIIRNVFLPTPSSENEYYHMLDIVDIANLNDVNVQIYEPDTSVYIADNTTITLTKREYLSRSTHPIFLLNVNANSSSLLYVSESAWENNDFKDRIRKSLNISDYIIFGAHGPIVKKDLVYENVSISAQILTPTDQITERLTFVDENTKLYSNVSEKSLFFIKEKDLNN